MFSLKDNYAITSVLIPVQMEWSLRYWPEKYTFYNDVVVKIVSQLAYQISAVLWKVKSS